MIKFEFKAETKTAAGTSHGASACANSEGVNIAIPAALSSSSDETSADFSEKLSRSKRLAGSGAVVKPKP